jgi:hypothetical protein
MTVPFELVIWNAQQCADYLGQSRQEFLRLTRHKESFPPELANRPRHWRACAVAEWALEGSSPSFFPQGLPKEIASA